MNRSTALLLAFATLLAHVLTVYQADTGRLGPPSDEVHAVFRLARQYVQGLGLGWMSGESALVGETSWAWFGLAAVAERLRWAPTLLAQLVAALGAIATVWVVSRFSPARLAGVIAPVLCVVSGPIAAAVGAGSEWTWFGLALATGFLAYEQGRGRLFGTALVLLVLTRPEGIVAVTGFALLWAAARTLGWRTGARRIGPVPVALAFAVEGLLAWARVSAGGSALSPTLAAAFAPAPGHLESGWAFAADFFLRSGGGPLLVVALVMGATGHLGTRGARALSLALAWIGFAVWMGGDRQPFWLVLAPALPLGFLALQEGVTRLVDAHRGIGRPLGWTLFGLGVLGSAFASKQPSDLGPLPIAGLHRAWQGLDRPLEDPLAVHAGREGLNTSVRRVQRLRALGVFLREHVPAGTTIATPWPGAIGYLSRRPVQDLFGRVTPLPGESAPRTAWGTPRTDLVAALAAEPDYVVPFLLDAPRPPVLRLLLEDWFQLYDEGDGSQERRRAFWNAIGHYDLVAVPVEVDGHGRLPYYLLRHRRLGMAPRLTIAREGERFHVEVHHAGHLQLVDLEISLRGEDDVVLSLRPTGEFTALGGVHTRTNLLLFPSGDRPVRIFEGRVPQGADGRTLVAVLKNPGSQAERAFSQVSAETSLPLR